MHRLTAALERLVRDAERDPAVREALKVNSALAIMRAILDTGEEILCNHW